jgi:dienelactone hydrolase
VKIERREFLESAGLATAGAALSNAPPVTAQRPLPKSEYDYVDWSWRRWRSITGQTRPRVVGEQSGKAELIYLHERKGKPIGAAEWGARREEIGRVLSAFLGGPPTSKPPLASKIYEETDSGHYTRRRLTFQTEAGEHVPAYLLTPKNRRGRLPAVLCPHQTTQAGKMEPAGLAGDPTLHTAVHLAERGYVTLTWDAVCFGERHDPASGHYGDAIPFYRRRPNWSLLGKMVWDASRAIDYLETLDFVDPARIGSVGHSHGGITTLFTMALDARVSAGASNCGFDTFRIDGNTFRWSQATALMPRLGFYVSSPRISMDFYRAVPDSEVVATPFDMHEVLALAAPRALFMSTSDADFVFPNGGWSARQSLARVEPVYRLLGAGDRVGSYYFSGGHNFPPAASSRAYEWLDRWLKA